MAVTVFLDGDSRGAPSCMSTCRVWSCVSNQAAPVIREAVSLKHAGFFTPFPPALMGFFAALLSRREQADQAALPPELGLDLLREGLLPGRRGRQVSGRGSAAQRVPGRDLVRQ